MSKIKDLTGQRFGKWTVLCMSQTKPVKWKLKCDCGYKRIMRSVNLISGKSRQCSKCSHCPGMESRRTHGHTSFKSVSREYWCWQAMKSRCLNNKNISYKNYGGRGIRVCERWINSFENFLADMGRKPSLKHSIERINNDGNYEPGNCRWATRAEQIANTRSAKRYSFNGLTMRLFEWADFHKLNRQVLYQRMYRKWSFERAITQQPT